MRCVSLALSLLVGIAACTAVPPPSVVLQTGDPTAIPSFAEWTRLETALQLPTADPGTCPSASGRSVSSAFGPGLGSGPVYPVGLGSTGVLETVDSGGERVQKVLWVASPDYPGPVLIRGGRIDASGTVTFALGAGAPVEELRLTASTATSAGQGEWREWPSYTYVPAAGCYAYQVDGLGFTQTIVFKATG